MSSEHYLAGPCEGISLHRKGCQVSIKDISGREAEATHVLEDEESAKKFEWSVRSELYAKYEKEDADWLAELEAHESSWLSDDERKALEARQ